MNWRDYGDTTLEAFVSEFGKVNSPMLGEVEAVYEAARPHSRLMLAMAWMEQKYATNSSIPTKYHNPLSLALPAGTPADGDDRWVRYPDFAAGVAAWKARILSPTYKDGVYARTVTLADLIRVYAPPSENDTNHYVDTVLAKMGTFPVRGDAMTNIPLKAVQMAGCNAPVMIPETLQFRRELIPTSQTNQRPGIPMIPYAYTQHETGNQSAGAGAAMHSRYMHQGAPDNAGNSQQLGYHLTLDDKVLIQMIPLNEVTWHAGDSGGDGNMRSIACELCVNVDSDREKSRELAAIVSSGVSNAMDLNTVVQHNHWSGKDCPMLIRQIGYWPTYMQIVARYQRGGEPTPTYAKPILLDLGEWDGRDRTLPDGTVLHACKRLLTARTKTKRYQVADVNAPSIGADLNRGDEAEIEYVFQAKKGGARWGYTRWGTRLRLAHFTPYVTITPKG